MKSSQSLAAIQYFLAPLNRNRPEDGTGIYASATGLCVYYSDGKSPWFFQMGTGTPTFYASQGALYLPDGRQASLSVDNPDMLPVTETKPNYDTYFMGRGQ